MNLKPCRDCGWNVSASATNCPYCGANDPTNAQAMATGIAWLIAIVVGIVVYFFVLRH